MVGPCHHDFRPHRYSGLAWAAIHVNRSVRERSFTCSGQVVPLQLQRANKKCLVVGATATKYFLPAFEPFARDLDSALERWYRCSGNERANRNYIWWWEQPLPNMCCFCLHSNRSQEILNLLWAGGTAAAATSEQINIIWWWEQPLPNMFYFWPHSNRSREILNYPVLYTAHGACVCYNAPCVLQRKPCVLQRQACALQRRACVSQRRACVLQRTLCFTTQLVFYNAELVLYNAELVFYNAELVFYNAELVF